MKYRLLEWLVCPQCRASDLALQTAQTKQDRVHHSSWEGRERELPGLNHEERELVEIEEGSLHCSQCSAVYPIVEGIPRMLPAGFKEGPVTAHRWTQFDGEAPEYEENFQDPLKNLA